MDAVGLTSARVRDSRALARARPADSLVGKRSLMVAHAARTLIPPATAGADAVTGMSWNSEDNGAGLTDLKSVCREVFMRLQGLSVLFAVLLVVSLLVPPDARAGAPTDYLRSRIDKLYELLGATGPESAPAANRQAARGILDQMFDWDEMGKRSLGQHWDARSAGERAEFVRLFSELFQRTYLARIQLADREKFQYLGEAPDGDRAVVKTKVITRKGREIPVDYHTRQRAGDQWKIYDLDIEGISLVTNYQNQFMSIIRRSSYQDLIQKLQALVQKGPGASRDDGVVLIGSGDIASCVGDSDEAPTPLLAACRS
jgi:phospholipid transport system substrate-binding protein